MSALNATWQRIPCALSRAKGSRRYYRSQSWQYTSLYMPLFGALNLSLMHPKLLLIIFFLLTPSQSQVERRPGSCTSDLETQLLCSLSPCRVMLGCHARMAHGKTNTRQNKHPRGTLPLSLSAQTSNRAGKLNHQGGRASPCKGVQKGPCAGKETRDIQFNAPEQTNA